MNKAILLTISILAGCSSGSDQPQNDQSEQRFANTAQVAYPGMTLSGIAPTLEEVFTTGRDSYWICSFSVDLEFYWQTVVYLYADGMGESVWNNPGSNFAVPESFDFLWDGEQQLNITSDEISLSIFNHNFVTDYTQVSGTPIYEFVADTSLGGIAVCSKNAGRWEDL